VGNNPSPGIIALLVVGLLVLILRWVWGRPRSRSAPPDASESPNLGLLTVVASALPRNDALACRARLGGAGIRSSMSKRSDGMLDVLVFHADVDDARALLES
jgi:hypothetical protein